MDEHRSRVTAQLAALARQPYAARGFPEHQGGTARYGEAVAAFEMLGHSDLSLFVKAGVQWGLFGGAVSLLGTSRHDDLVPRIISGELQGCFAMTETGHGSDVQSLLTTATFDPATDEIVVHSPVPARAQGLHRQRGARRQPRSRVRPARRRRRVPRCALRARPDPRRRRRSRAGRHHRGLRSQARPRRRRQRAAALRPRPGAPHQPARPLRRHRRRRHLLEPHRQPQPPLLHDARHARPRPHLGGRRSGRRARSALAVTTTYAGGRRQFAAPGSDVETTVLDYRTYQRRLLPRIATAYALQLAQHELVSAMDDVLAGRTTSEQDQRQLETRAAGIKVLTTRHATDTIQECRELCGGAGYLWANRLAALKADTDIFTTFEGDNTVLLQLVAKSLLTEYQATFGDLDTAGIVRFGARLVGGTVIERSSARGIIQRLVDAAPGREEDVTFGIRGTQLRLLREREEHLIEGLARRLRRATAPGADAFAVFNATQDHLVDAGTAHVERVVAESFAASVESCADDGGAGGAEQGLRPPSALDDRAPQGVVPRARPAEPCPHQGADRPRQRGLRGAATARHRRSSTPSASRRACSRRRCRDHLMRRRVGRSVAGGRALVATAAVDEGRARPTPTSTCSISASTSTDQPTSWRLAGSRRTPIQVVADTARGPQVGLLPLGEPERPTRGRHGAGEGVREPLVTRPEQGDDRRPGLHELVEQVRVGVQETHDPAGLARWPRGRTRP